MYRSPASIAATARLQAAREAQAEADRLAAADSIDTEAITVRTLNTVQNLGCNSILATLALADRLAAWDAATLAAWTDARGTDAGREEVIAWAAAHRLLAE